MVLRRQITESGLARTWDGDTVAAGKTPLKTAHRESIHHHLDPHLEMRHELREEDGTSQRGYECRKQGGSERGLEGGSCSCCSQLFINEYVKKNRRCC